MIFGSIAVDLGLWVVFLGAWEAGLGAWWTILCVFGWGPVFLGCGFFFGVWVFFGAR